MLSLFRAHTIALRSDLPTSGRCQVSERPIWRSSTTASFQLTRVEDAERMLKENNSEADLIEIPKKFEQRRMSWEVTTFSAGSELVEEMELSPKVGLTVSSGLPSSQGEWKEKFRRMSRESQSADDDEKNVWSLSQEFWAMTNCYNSAFCFQQRGRIKDKIVCSVWKYRHHWEEILVGFSSHVQCWCTKVEGELHKWLESKRKTRWTWMKERGRDRTLNFRCTVWVLWRKIIIEVLRWENQESEKFRSPLSQTWELKKKRGFQ